MRFFVVVMLLLLTTRGRSVTVEVNGKNYELAVQKQTEQGVEDLLESFLAEHEVALTVRELFHFRSVLVDSVRRGIFPKDDVKNWEPTLAETHHRQYGNPWSLGRDVFDWMMRRGLRSHWRVLDVGCGTMRLGIWLTEFLESGHYTGVEPDAESLRVARDYEIPLHGLQQKSPTLLADLGDVVDGSMDAVILFSVINHLDRNQQVKLFRRIAHKTRQFHHRIWISHAKPRMDVLEEAAIPGFTWLPPKLIIPGVQRRLSGNGDDIPVWEIRHLPRSWVPKTCGHDHRPLVLSSKSSEDDDEVVWSLATTIPARLVVGCGSSGTSIVTRALAAHPSKIHAIWESSAAYNNREMPSKSATMSVLQSFEEWTLAANRSAYIEKTPSHVCNLGGFLASGAVAVFVIRDGRDVVASMRASRPTSSIRLHSTRWVNDNMAGLMYAGDERLVTLKYEEFVLQPRKQLERIANHLGLDSSADAVQKMASSTISDAPDTLFAERRLQLQFPIHNQSIGTWRDRLSPADIVDFAGTGAYRLLGRLGYLSNMTTSSTTKVAYCISGTARTLREPRVLSSIKRFAEGNAGDFFYAIELTSNRETPPLSENAYAYDVNDVDSIFQVLPPQKIAVVDGEAESDCAWRWCLPQFTKLEKCYEMIEEQEAARGLSYEWLVRLRPDVEYDELPPAFSELSADRIYAQRQGVHVCDMFAIVPRRLAAEYFNIGKTCPPEERLCLQSQVDMNSVPMPGCTCWLTAHLSNRSIKVDLSLGLSYRVVRDVPKPGKYTEDPWPPVWTNLPRYYHGASEDEAYFLFRHRGRTINVTSSRESLATNDTATGIVREACVQAEVSDQKCAELLGTVLRDVVPSFME